MDKKLKDRLIIIKGAGEMATGVACRLYGANLQRILMLETESPLAVRRHVSFCEAVHDGAKCVEGVEAVCVSTQSELFEAWQKGQVAVRVDPLGESVSCLKPDVLVDATLAKRNLGIAADDAQLVIAIGPGFEAGRDCHVVIESNRGHDLGRLLRTGRAVANTGVPGVINGYTLERVLRSPRNGIFITQRMIGDEVREGEVLGMVSNAEVVASINGILRGLIRPGSSVTKNLKIGDIDPRGEKIYCETISEKARSLGGAVLEAILADFNT